MIKMERDILKREYCNKIFDTKYHMNVHIKIHSDDKEYKCNICNKKLIRNRDHINI